MKASGRAIAVAALLMFASTVFAANAVTPVDLQQRVGIDPQLGALLPLDAPFLDEVGATRRLDDWIAGRPTIIALAYFKCPNLCSVTLDALSRAVARARLAPATDFQVIAISIDPSEGPAQAARWHSGHRDHFGQAEWHFLTGDEAGIRAVTRSVGYRYFWDASQGQYAHPAGAVVVSGAGRIVEYLNGVEFPAADLRRALTLAAAGRSGSVVDRFWLLCYHYTALTGRYSGDITIALRLLGLASVGVLAFLLFRLIRIRG